jgi:hypothetical protein
LETTPNLEPAGPVRRYIARSGTNRDAAARARFHLPIVDDAATANL